MKFLFIVFLLFVLFVFLFGFSILRMLFKGIFGIQSKPNNPSQNRQKANSSSQKAQAQSTKKIITRDEGEYIEFEEIKE